MKFNLLKSAISVVLLSSAIVFGQQGHQHGKSADQQPATPMCRMQASAQSTGDGKAQSRMCCSQGGEGSCCAADAQAGKGMACCREGGAGMGQPGDMATIHSLFDGRESITRRYKDVEGGIESWTESDDPKLAGLIQTHLASMSERLEKRQPIHQRDPLFVEIFKYADKIEMKVENTSKGVHVIETSKDPYVAELIRAHARTIDGFVKEGHSEAMKDHALPPKRK